MLPQKPSGDAPKSELKIFERLAAECPDDWTIIHSLGITNHKNKVWAEADFVVINQAGVLVIEVKGGAIRREDGDWFQNDLRIKESPIEQAKNASFALIELLHGKGLGKGGWIDSAVLFPDVLFSVDSSDVHAARIGDAKALDGSIADWITGVQRHYSEAHGRGGDDLTGVSAAGRSAIVDALAGDFELRPTISAAAGDARREMIRFTQEQEEMLHTAEDNPRALFDGGAGTGKTVLALQRAVDAGKDGSKVLLLCFNKGLVRSLADQLSGNDAVDVFHFHGLIDHILDLAQKERPEHVAGDYFDTVLPELAIEALVELDDPPLYDYLVVDEAQDLLYGAALDVFELVLRGGLTDGRWCFFRDSGQDIYGKETAEAEARLLDAHPAKSTLRRNCRNTGPIANFTASRSCRDPSATPPVARPQVQIFEFDEESDQKKAAGRVLTEWIKDGIDPGSIVVLSKKKRDGGVFSDGLPPGVPAPLEDLAKDGETQNPKAIRFSTIHSFKGLEADAVLLLNLGDPDDEVNKKLLYVGLSRARLLLAAGVSVRNRARVEELVAGLDSIPGALERAQAGSRDVRAGKGIPIEDV